MSSYIEKEVEELLFLDTTATPDQATEVVIDCQGSDLSPIDTKRYSEAIPVIGNRVILESNELDSPSSNIIPFRRTK
ncbi:hypothetical protein KDA00_01665 [Candidatus Saccharibacteria bacterium]|nr:hypothetical protein [Candidatus Saccharibacteria bacterium]